MIRDYLPYWTPWERVVVVVDSVVAVQPPTKIATRARNISAIRFFFIVPGKRIWIALRMGFLRDLVVTDANQA